MTNYIEYSIPITSFKLNNNYMIIPEEVMIRAIQDSINCPIVTSIEYNNGFVEERVIGKVIENGDIQMWHSGFNPEYCEIEPEFVANKSHEEDNKIIMDDITIRGFYFKQKG